MAEYNKVFIGEVNLRKSWAMIEWCDEFIGSGIKTHSGGITPDRCFDLGYKWLMDDQYSSLYAASHCTIMYFSNIQDATLFSLKWA